MKLKRKIIISILIITSILAISLINLSIVYLHKPSSLKENYEIIIKPGQNSNIISEKLYLDGIIEQPKLFAIYLKLYNLTSKLKSGEYLFTPNISPLQIIRILTSGKSIIRKLVIPEGLSVYEALSLIDNIKILTGEISYDIPEGYLFPNTYFYSYGDQKQKIVALMKKKMSETLDKYVPELSEDSYLKTRLDVLTLASIIEKETILSKEKPRIAAVYLNRLNKKMRLQADPTTIYAITKGKYAFDRYLKHKDLKIESPFNTYRVSGLPPTPICCPGEEAIKAAVHPANTNELYFVSEGNGSGKHHFANSFKEHVRNIAKYRKARKK